MTRRRKELFGIAFIGNIQRDWAAGGLGRNKDKEAVEFPQWSQATGADDRLEYRARGSIEQYLVAARARRPEVLDEDANHPARMGRGRLEARYRRARRLRFDRHARQK